MPVAEMSGQTGIFILLGLGIVIILLFRLITLISTLSKSVDAIEKAVSAAGVNNKYVPINESPSLEEDSAVPSAVIAAISAAVNQYRIVNK
jgi:Na+-transporting methylmalonyl-CoA/oxaloacetate decarboxylase gamma subunit